MKTKITVLVLLLCTITYGQKKIKLKKHQTETGEVFKVGDVLWLGEPSGEDGKYQFIRVGGWAQNVRSKGMYLSGRNEDRPFTIKKMFKYDDPKWKSVHVTLGSSSSTNFRMDLDNALANGEIKQKNKKKPLDYVVTDKYDKLSKLKKLLDQGVLSQEEFDIEKKKVLEGN